MARVIKDKMPEKNKSSPDNGKNWDKFKKLSRRILTSNAFWISLIILVNCALVFLYHPQETKIKPPEIKPYVLPVFTGDPPPMKRRPPRQKTSHARKKLALSLLTKGGKALQSKSFSRAAQIFRQALALDPENQQYQNALDYALRMAEWKNDQSRIDEAFQRKKPDKAWEIFDKKVHEDPGFFFFAVPHLARNLLDNGQTASGVAVLLTYCRLRPRDQEASLLLTKYRSRGN